MMCHTATAETEAGVVPFFFSSFFFFSDLFVQLLKSVYVSRFICSGGEPGAEEIQCLDDGRSQRTN